MRIRRTEAERGGQKPPEGWIYLARGPKYTKATLTEGYLNRRMNRTNTIAMNQHYVEKVMENPRTSYWNRMAVAEYVISHPERFMPLSDRTDDPELNEYARKKNGNARRDFLEEFRRRYVLRRRSNTFLIETSYRARRFAACRGGARPVHIEEIHNMKGSNDAETLLCEIVWMMDCDFKAIMVMPDHDVEVSCTSRNTMTCNRPDPGFFRMRPPDGVERPAAREDVDLPEGEWE